MFCLLSYSKACDTLVLVILVHSKHSTHNNCKFSIMKRNKEEVSTETPPKRPYHKYTLEWLSDDSWMTLGWLLDDSGMTLGFKGETIQGGTLIKGGH